MNLMEGITLFLGESVNFMAHYFPGSRLWSSRGPFYDEVVVIKVSL